VEKCAYKPYLTQNIHNQAIAAYVNKEIISHLAQKEGVISGNVKKRDAKLERIMK